jgi:uncharacterized protein YuzE
MKVARSPEESMYVMLDDEVGDATIYLTEAEPSSTTVSYPVECRELKGELILDVNAQGQLISIEVLGAWGPSPQTS